eukprot:13095714-Alexandrium_andersonii.AAC.1
MLRWVKSVAARAPEAAARLYMCVVVVRCAPSSLRLCACSRPCLTYRRDAGHMACKGVAPVVFRPPLTRARR